MTETINPEVDSEVVDAELVPDPDETENTEDEGTEEDSSETTEASTGNGKPRSRRSKKGEVAKIEPQPVAEDNGETSSFTKTQARRLTAKLKGNLRASADAIMEAYDGRIWIALDYPSWQDYLDSELGEYRVKLPAVERKELVAKMSASKKDGGSAMSSRAIASALGVDQKTVVNDRKDLGLVKVDSERADGEPAKVVGMDGRETMPRPAAPRLVALADRFTTLVTQADTHLGDLLALTTDERWEDEASQVASRHRADLARMAKTLMAIVQALPGNDA